MVKFMNRFRSRTWLYVLVAAMCVSSGFLSVTTVKAGCDAEYFQVNDPSAAVMLVDTVVVRPLTFVASVAGAAVWIVSLPFTLLAGTASEAGDVLVLDPFCYTFKRPLGHMEESTPIKQY
jgi:hypothetical protein